MKKSYLFLLMVVLIIVFGGCGGSSVIIGDIGDIDSGGSDSRQYRFSALDGVWRITSASGSFSGYDGVSSMTLNENSLVNRVALTYNGENSQGSVGRFTIQSHSEYRIAGKNGPGSVLVLNNPTRTNVSVSRVSNNTFRYTLDSSTITIKYINNNRLEAIEQGFTYLNGYRCTFNITYTLIRR